MMPRHQFMLESPHILIFLEESSPCRPVLVFIHSFMAVKPKTINDCQSKTAISGQYWLYFAACWDTILTLLWRNVLYPPFIVLGRLDLSFCIFGRAHTAGPKSSLVENLNGFELEDGSNNMGLGTLDPKSSISCQSDCCHESLRCCKRCRWGKALAEAYLWGMSDAEKMPERHQLHSRSKKGFSTPGMYSFQIYPELIKALGIFFFFFFWEASSRSQDIWIESPST